MVLDCRLVRPVAFAYAVLPSLILLLGWLRPPFALPLCLPLAPALRSALASLGRPRIMALLLRAMPRFLAGDRCRLRGEIAG